MDEVTFDGWPVGMEISEALDSNSQSQEVLIQILLLKKNQLNRPNICDILVTLNFFLGFIV